MTKVTNVVIAAAAGFVAGILLAPKSGKETREDLKNKALDAKEYAVETADRVKVKAAHGYAVVREGAGHIGEEVTGFVGRARHSVEEVADDAKKTGRKVAKEAEQTGRRASR